ncbi:hypothetical protein QJQ45_017142 [Haematococcus lacustris]|nr:hypothetical protein QJQ45_017142 [Haematococcus lacustris]
MVTRTCLVMPATLAGLPEIRAATLPTFLELRDSDILSSQPRSEPLGVEMSDPLLTVQPLRFADVALLAPSSSASAPALVSPLQPGGLKILDKEGRMHAIYESPQVQQERGQTLLQHSQGGMSDVELRRMLNQLQLQQRQHWEIEQQYALQQEQNQHQYGQLQAAQLQLRGMQALQQEHQAQQVQAQQVQHAQLQLLLSGLQAAAKQSTTAGLQQQGTGQEGHDQAGLLGPRGTRGVVAAAPNTWPHPQPPRRVDMQQVDEAMVALAAEIQPSHLELEYMKAAFGLVQTLLLRQFPTAKVHLYGSAATGTLVTGSRAIDICLELREVGQSKPERAMVLDILQDILQAEGMAEVLALPKARVPVIKFVVPATGTRVDLTVNNMLPLVNTHLLRCYVAVDPRLRQLVLLVKHWAKRRGVNDTYRGTLSSYSYVLLCIALLQQRSPPILPKLQAMQPASLMRYEVTTGSWACTFCDDIDALQGCGAANTETLAELLLAFFDHWAWRHDYNNAVVSIRTGCMLAKRDKDWMRRVERDWHLMSIEDPFDLSHDLGRTVDWRSIRTLRTEFERAARVMALEAA